MPEITKNDIRFYINNFDFKIFKIIYQIIKSVSTFWLEVDSRAVEGERLVTGVNSNWDRPVFGDRNFQSVQAARCHVNVILGKSRKLGQIWSEVQNVCSKLQKKIQILIWLCFNSKICNHFWNLTKKQLRPSEFLEFDSKIFVGWGDVMSQCMLTTHSVLRLIQLYPLNFTKKDGQIQMLSWSNFIV